MKELDFDELDRAVSSLMSGVPKTDTTPPDDGIKTLTITPTLDAAGNPSTPPSFSVPSAAVPAPSPSAPAPVATEADSNTVSRGVQLTERSSLANRRSGRFMDVVHSSSDMTRSTPARPISRQGVTLVPATPAQDEPAEVNAADDITSPTPVAPAPTEVESSTPTAHEWPDPLDIFSDEQQSEPAPAFSEELNVDTVADPEVLEEAPEIAPVEEVSDNQQEPLVTPFLADAKVEKRPLGGVSGEPASVEANVAIAEAAADPIVETPAPELELPEELQDKLVAIEAGLHLEEPEAMPVTTVPIVAAPAADVQPAAPSGPISIPQQYREEPATGDQTNGSIYDTANYHKPLDHPAKKKSGWLWIVWVLGLLILGGAGGAAAYLYLLK